MNRFLSIILFLSFSIISFSQTIDKYKQDGVIVFQLKTSATPIESVNKIVDLRSFYFIKDVISKYDVQQVKQLFPNHKNEKLARTYKLKFANIFLADEFINDIKSVSEIEYAESNVLYYATEVPNDNEYGNTWDGAVLNRWPLDSVHANEAWDISHGDPNIIIAPLEGGFNLFHPDLVNKFLQGYDVGEDDNDVSGNTAFYEEHGNAVAGISGAETNNGFGISSLSWGCMLLPVKVVDGNGTYGPAMDGIVWATDNGANIITMSFTGTAPSYYAQTVCDYAWNNGTILVGAAGNNGSMIPGFPASYNHVVSVASTDETDTKADFSNYNNAVDISAPGTATGSTWQTGYHNFGGTSSATPFTSSLLALIKSYAVNVTNEDIINILTSSAKNIDAINPNYIGYIGAGRVNAYQAMLLAQEFSATNSRTNDVGIINISSPNGQSCNETISPIITLRNFGTDNLQSVTINYQIDGGATQSFNWTGNLSQNQTVIINLPNTTTTTGVHSFTVNTSMPNGSTDENTSNDSRSSDFKIIQNGGEVILNIQTDNYAFETSWEILDASNNVVFSGSRYEYAIEGVHIIDTLCLENGCYTFKIYDAVGNGFYSSYQNIPGNFSMTYLNGEQIFEADNNGEDFTDVEAHSFCIFETDAGIKTIANPIDITCTSDISPIITLINYGSSNLNSVNINYQIDGGSTQTYNWSGNLESGYSTDVTLPIISTSISLHTLNIYTSLPNGITDEDTSNDTAQADFNTLPTSAIPLPFNEDFENGFDNQNWTITNPDGLLTWEIATVGGSSPGNKASKRKFYDELPASQDRDAMITQSLDFSGYSAINLSLDYAYKRKTSSTTLMGDSLIIYVSTDCGETFTRVMSEELSADNYSFSEFTPSTYSDWHQSGFIVNLNTYAYQNNIIIKFETYNTIPISNNLFIDNINIIGDNPPNNAMFISQTVPTLVAPNEIFNTTVTYKNTGTNTWTNADSHILGTQNPQDNIIWGSRVPLPNNVAPGEEVTFNLTLTAPSTVGDYNFQRRMLQDMVEWFGDFTPNIVIRVDTINDASFISQTVPATVNVGDNFDVYLTFENTGNKTWSSNTMHSLGTQNPIDNTIWGTGRFALPNDVLPGEQVTITASLTAPSTAGTYNLQTKMVQDNLGWFGDLSDNAIINVELSTDIIITKEKEIIIVPNPVKASNSINIIGSFNNNDKIILIDINGKPIIEQNISDNNIYINLSKYNLAEGVYFVKIYNNKTVITKKLIVVN